MSGNANEAAPAASNPTAGRSSLHGRGRRSSVPTTPKLDADELELDDIRRYESVSLQTKGIAWPLLDKI